MDDFLPITNLFHNRIVDAVDLSPINENTFSLKGFRVWIYGKYGSEIIRPTIFCISRFSFKNN